MILGTAGLSTCKSWLDEFCTEVRKVHKECHIQAVFGFPSARVYGEEKATI